MFGAQEHWSGVRVRVRGDASSGAEPTAQTLANSVGNPRANSALPDTPLTLHAQTLALDLAPRRLLFDCKPQCRFC